MTIKVYTVDLQVQQNNNDFESLLGQHHHMDLVPRKGDTINIDSTYYEVIGVEYSYKDQSSPTVYLKPVGGYEEFVRGMSEAGA